MRQAQDEAENTVSVSAVTEGTTLRLRLSGDVDLASVPRTREEVRNHLTLEELPPVVVLDLSGVTFMDSAGLALLVELHRQYGAGTQLSLVAQQRSQPERVLKLGQFDQFFSIEFVPKTTEGSDTNG